jgi:arginine exporter protein ArgO
MTILSFTAVFAGMGLGATGTGRLDAGWLVTGVFCGSLVWWVILSSANSLFNARMTPKTMRRINGLSGTVLTGFGLLAVIATI